MASNSHIEQHLRTLAEVADDDSTAMRLRDTADDIRKHERDIVYAPAAPAHDEDLADGVKYIEPCGEPSAGLAALEDTNAADVLRDEWSTRIAGSDPEGTEHEAELVDEAFFGEKREPLMWAPGASHSNWMDAYDSVQYLSMEGTACPNGVAARKGTEGAERVDTRFASMIRDDEYSYWDSLSDAYYGE